MKLQPGKYIIQKGNHFATEYEYWMIYHHQGQHKICIDAGFPSLIKDGENEIYLDDGMKVVHSMPINRPIAFKSGHMELHTVDEFGFSKVFKMRRREVLDRILRKFPNIEAII